MAARFLLLQKVTEGFTLQRWCSTHVAGSQPCLAGTFEVTVIEWE